ncbi:hypothetical protein [Sporosarcina sp. ITBMC105]
METNQTMSLKEWIITLILITLPIVNIIMLIIWATDKQERRNTFAKAYLIVMGCVFAFIFVIYAVIFFFAITFGLMLGQ